MRIWLRRERDEHGLTQREMAEHLNISTRQYQRIETGASVGSIKIWDALQEWFHIDQKILRENF